MLTLYTLDPSRADRIEWILNHLKLEYQYEIYGRNPHTKLADPAMKNVHPTGKAPLLRDGDIVLAESGVIIQYLVEKYGKDSDLAPKNEEDKWQIQYGLVAAESNFMIATLQLYINSIARSKAPWGISFLIGKVLDTIEAGYARPELKNCLKFLDETFKTNNGYFSHGHISGADFMYFFNINMVRTLKLIPNFETEYPNVTTWAKNMKELTTKEADPKLKIKTVDHRAPDAATKL